VEVHASTFKAWFFVEYTITCSSTKKYSDIVLPLLLYKPKNHTLLRIIFLKSVYFIHTLVWHNYNNIKIS